jgi:uncharacterized protein with HEPN domain
MLEAISRIEKYAARGRDAFELDELIQNWMVSHLQIIGEAARAMSLPLKTRHPDIPWRRIGAMRNILVHQYFGIDTDIVWEVVEENLPDLKRAIAAVLAMEEGSSGPSDAETSE